MEDLLPEKEGCEKDGDIDSDDDENQQTWSLEECHFAQHPEELSSVQLVHFPQTSCEHMPLRITNGQ